MWRYLFMGLSLVSFATYGPSLLQDKIDGNRAQGPVAAEQATLAKSEPAVQADNPSAGRSVKIPADARGHFIAKAKLNGRSVDVLVDTGATQVAINETMARRIGIKLAKADFKYKVNTANGETRAAAAVIESVEIGRVRVENVQASILKDDALQGILLGMSFLKALKSVEVRSGTLVLTQ
jgi:aspartyl protease family protein